MEKEPNTVEAVSNKASFIHSNEFLEMTRKCKDMQQELQRLKKFWTEYNDERPKETKLRNLLESNSKNFQELITEYDNLQIDIKNKIELLQIKKEGKV